MKRTLWPLLILLVMLPATAMLYAQSLSLQDCRSLALQNAASMSVAKLGVESGTAMRKASVTAFLPSLNAMGSFMHSDKTIEYKEDLNLQQLLGGMAQANPAVD